MGLDLEESWIFLEIGVSILRQWRGYAEGFPPVGRAPL